MIHHMIPDIEGYRMPTIEEVELGMLVKNTLCMPTRFNKSSVSDL